MDKVESLDRYKELLAETKEKCGRRLVTNSYMFLDEIRRYIDLGRLYYEKLENGIVFYSDEESHYRCYFHADLSGGTKRDKKIEKKDKLLLTQLLYRNERTAKESEMASWLEEVGFILKDTMDYIVEDRTANKKKIEPLVKHILRLLDESHLTFRTLLPNEVEQLLEFQKNIDCIPYYQLSYHSPEEYGEAIRDGRLEGVLDLNGNLCAAHYFDAENGRIGGWYAIKKEYQKTYGIVMLFNYSAMKYAEENNIGEEYGWVMRGNKESVKYHKKSGWIWEGRVMEEWMLGD